MYTYIYIYIYIDIRLVVQLVQLLVGGSTALS